MKKRSVTINGHKTSITLEEPFWQEIKEIADKESKSLSVLLSEIDQNRDESHGAPVNLSSAIRLYVLGFLQKQR